MLLNMEFISVDLRFKAKVAWRGGDELFHHKLPNFVLAFRVVDLRKSR